MPIPNTITRTLELPHPQDRVWRALTTLDGLTGWFGSHAEGAVEPGQDVVMSWQEHDGHTAVLAVKVVDPMSVFAYAWAVNGAPEGDPRKTYVEFRLEKSQDGTRLTVTESGFAQLPDAWLESSYQGNTEGWRTQLSKLPTYLDAAA